jgi:hypothetical protein
MSLNDLSGLLLVCLGGLDSNQDNQSQSLILATWHRTAPKRSTSKIVSVYAALVRCLARSTAHSQEPKRNSN